MLEFSTVIHNNKLSYLQNYCYKNQNQLLKPEPDITLFN